MKYLIKYLKKGCDLPSFTIIFASSYDQAVSYASNLPSIHLRWGKGQVIDVIPLDNIIAETLDVHIELLVKGIGDMLADNNLELSQVGETNLYELRSTIRNIINESIQKL